MSHVAGPRGEELAATLEALEFSGVARAEGPDGLLAEVALGLADRANGRPNLPSTRFEVASVGKMFTAVAIARLWERGGTAPRSYLAQVLPPDRRPRTLDPGVTIEHLLTHTSGIGDYVDEVGGERYEDLWLTTSPAAVRGPADLLPLFVERPALFAPGERVRYCDAGFVLLGLVLETRTGRAYVDVIADEVFAPAGMTSAGFPALDDVEPDLAIGYLPPDERTPRWRSHVYAIPARGQPDGGAYVTAGDLVRFMDAFSGARLTGPGVLAEMLRTRVHDDDEGGDWGYGLLHRGEGPRARYGHGGEDPGASARLAHYHRAGIRVAVVSNVTDGAGAAFRAIEAALIPE